MAHTQSSDTALLVIDLYNASFEPKAADARKKLLPHVIRLLNHARAKSWRIFLIREGFADDLSDAPHYIDRSDTQWIASHPGMQLIEELRPYLNSSEEIIKTRHSVFDGTGLRERLKKDMGIRNIVLVGVNTDMCILTTAMTGRQDFPHVFIPIECIAPLPIEFYTSRGPQTGLAALEVMKPFVDVVTLDNLIANSANLDSVPRLLPTPQPS